MNDHNANSRLAAAKRLVSALEALGAAQEAVRVAEAEYAATGTERTQTPVAPLPATGRAGLTTPAGFPARASAQDQELLAALSATPITVKEGVYRTLARMGPLTNAELLDAMLAHGFPGLRTANAADALRGAIWHMVKDAQVVKLEGGKYDLPHPARTREKVG